MLKVELEEEFEKANVKIIWLESELERFKQLLGESTDRAKITSATTEAQNSQLKLSEKAVRACFIKGRTLVNQAVELQAGKVVYTTEYSGYKDNILEKFPPQEVNYRAFFNSLVGTIDAAKFLALGDDEKED